jgi:hypothetical protein
MWDLALMTIFINRPLYVGYSSSQYRAEVLQYIHLYPYIDKHEFRKKA